MQETLKRLDLVDTVRHNKDMEKIVGKMLESLLVMVRSHANVSVVEHSNYCVEMGCIHRRQTKTGGETVSLNLKDYDSPAVAKARKRVLLEAMGLHSADSC